MIRTTLRSLVVFVLLAHLSGVTFGATMSASPQAPVVDGYDLANLGGVSGTDKWWNDGATSGRPKGQSFTTPAGALRLNSITYQVTDSQKAEPIKTYVIRVGVVAGETFTEIYSETATQATTWNGGEYMTWHFASPPLLQGNTTYGVDIGMVSSTTAWQTGIPYINRTANQFSGGSRYMSGTSGGGIGDGTMNNMSGDLVFHLDLESPTGPGFELVATSPASGAEEVLASNPLVGTFSQELVPGVGKVVLRNLTDAIETGIPMTDPRVTVAGNLLTIAPGPVLEWGKEYAVWIEPSALANGAGEEFAGIADDATWTFTTAAGDPLLDAVAELKAHINGLGNLTAAQIAAHKATIDLQRNRFDDNAGTIAAVFDLISTYDAVVGPLWVARGQFDRDNQVDDLDWTIYHVMQYIMDEVYHAGALSSHEGLLEGFKFGSSANFPGALAPPGDPENRHVVSIDGSFEETFGRNTQGWTLPARKPTGTYLAPGTVATVEVPPSLVGRGYAVRVGAHSWDLSHRRWVRRLDRATLLYDLDAPAIKVASPYGGGIYIEVPFGAEAGVVEVAVTGAVRSPYFSAKSFHRTSLEEWTDTERHHRAPWADFQTEKFMMQVPTSWIYTLPDPVTLMADWDAAMDIMNDLMGFPRLRGKETQYPQVDVLMRSSVHAPGYPSVNNVDNSNNDRGGYHNNYLVRGPRTGWSTEFHEQGHAYFFPKFGGESESTVNLLHAAVWNRAFGYDLDHAFAGSFGFEGNPNRTLDNTAVTWMTVFNFSPREVPMATAEKAYQLKGHAKFVDLAGLFGWEGLDAFWYSYNLDEEGGDSSHGDDDDKLLRLCQSVGADIRPLFHFWGIHPKDPGSLADALAEAGLEPPVEIYDRLSHYKSLVPVDNAAFRAFVTGWWGRQPSIGGAWTEREHARQWDTTALYGAGDQQRSEATNPGEIYNETSAADIKLRVQELLDLYYPDGRPVTDYELWASLFAGSDLSDPDGDFDGDTLSNAEERIWGLDPTDAGSQSPISRPLGAAGALSYSRRDPLLTGLTYTVWCSSTLEPGSWMEDAGAVQLVGDPDDNGVEVVLVTLSPELLASSQLFVRVQAE